ncbi:hypothetical protein KEM48_006457 [Puccinia striiformis f. sp. tritici PST-130]|nr:hypothetical protein KEM48_006457 [Puccinia striiformis f. sp. tritici PST-130]
MGEIGNDFCIFSLLPGLERANCSSRLSTSVVNIDQQTFYLHILESSFTCAHNAQRLKRRALISRISQHSESVEGAVVPVLIDQHPSFLPQR